MPAQCRGYLARTSSKSPRMLAKGSDSLASWISARMRSRNSARCFASISATFLCFSAASAAAPARLRPLQRSCHRRQLGSDERYVNGTLAWSTFASSGQDRKLEAEYLVCCVSVVGLRQIPVSPVRFSGRSQALVLTPNTTRHSSRPAPTCCCCSITV